MISLKIETKAQEVLDQVGIRTSPVLVEKIAKHFDIEVKRGPSDEFSGLLLRKVDKAFIAVNSNEAKVRQRFTIAHELGRQNHQRRLRQRLPAPRPFQCDVQETFWYDAQ